MTTTPAPAAKSAATTAVDEWRKKVSSAYGVEQLTRLEMLRLSPEQINTAFKEGKLQAVQDGDVGPDDHGQPAGPDSAAGSDSPKALAEWHEAMAEKYGVEQLTLAEMEALSTAEIAAARKEGKLQAVQNGEHGPKVSEADKAPHPAIAKHFKKGQS